MSTPNAPEKVTIIGAGLVGSLLSLFLARRGHEVEVFEWRPDMRRADIPAGRSINLAISARGLSALRQVGLEEDALQNAVPMRGRMIHPVQGALTLQPYGKDGTQCINSISRGWLNKRLMTAAEATGRVKIHFQHNLTAVDLDARTITVKDELAGTERTLSVPRLFGTDGTNSLIRTSMNQRAGTTVTADVLSSGYKELTITPEKAREFGMELNALHIWPRGTYMLIALPNTDGSYTCTLFLGYEGPISFATLGDHAAVQAFFETQFPDVMPMIPTLVEDFFRNPTGQMVTVKAPTWNEGGHAALLGDAAHAIVPFFGQGMNCGFEDCVRLIALLEQEGGDWDRTFALYGKERKTNADAIADMAVENFIEMRDKVADPRFVLEKEIERVLQHRFPETFISRYSYVSFSTVPYRYAYDVGAVQAGILNALSEGRSDIAQVDLALADKLVAERLVPYLAQKAAARA